MLRSVDFYGLRAVEFSFGDYTALVVPGQGANLVRLAHTGLGAEILRTPAADEIETFLRRPQVFGMPLLFPPNRIGDGRYRFDGREYRFPITIERENNYHHGILKSQPFAVSKAWETDEETLVECRYYSNAGNDAVFRDVQVCVTWIYERMAYGGEQYPGFFTLHSLGFMGKEKSDGKRRMQKTWHHILSGLCDVLRQDEKIRPDAFTDQFTPEKFADVLFSLTLSALLRQDYDPSAVLEIVRRTLY